MGHVPLTMKFNKPDKESVALFLWLNLNLLLAATRYILSHVGHSSGSLREVILFIITCIPYIYILMGNREKTLSNSFIAFVRIYLAVLVAFALSLLFNPQLKEFYFRDSYGIGPVFRPDGAIYAFLFFVMINDSDKLHKVITSSAYISFFYLVVVVFIPAMRRGYFLDIAPDGGMKAFRYSLSFGYDMLFPLTVFFTAALKSHSIIHYAISAISAVLIIGYGGRGAIVVLFLFVAILVVIRILDGNTSSTKKFVLITGVVLVGIVILIFGDQLLELLISILTRHNINSRSIEMFLGGSFSDSNGRDKIWRTVLEAIPNGLPFGYGLFGDRPFVAPLHYAGYSHNLFLELLVSFGVIGAVCIIYIISDAIRMIILCRDENWRIIYVILFVCSCKLLLSLTLWYSWEFWAAAAVAYRYRLMKRTQKMTNQYQINIIKQAQTIPLE